MNTELNYSYAGKWDYPTGASIIAFYAPIKLANTNATGVVVAGWSYAGWDATKFNETTVQIFAPTSSGFLELRTSEYILDPTINGTGSIVIFDFNNDYIDDIFLPAHNESPNIDKASTLYLSRPDGSFSKVIIDDATRSHSAQIGYLNGTTIVVTGGYGSTEPYYSFNERNQTFDVNLWGNTYSGRIYTSSSAVADLDGDGLSELVIGELKTGPGYPFDKDRPYVIAIYRLDDAALDESPEVLLTPYFNGKADLYSNYKSEFPGLDHIHRIWIDDFNFDGKPDIIAGTTIWNTDTGFEKSKLQLFQNNGNMNFIDVTDNLGSAYSENNAVVDYNRKYIDIDNSGIPSLFMSTTRWQRAGSSVDDTANYLLLNDGTGKLYAALHTQFIQWGEEVLDYAKTLDLGRVNINGPAFVPVINSDGLINYLVDVKFTDKNNSEFRGSLFINVDAQYNLTTDFKENVTIEDRNYSKLMRTWAGDDIIYDLNRSLSDTNIDGGLGRDTVAYSTAISGVVLNTADDIISVNFDNSYSDYLNNIERIEFSDVSVSFDISHSANSELVYRIYQAAFARTPDEGGFRFWEQYRDQLTPLQYAKEFRTSAEFAQKYGANVSNDKYTETLYRNVLQREPDVGGLSFWQGVLNSGGLDRDQLLIEFAACDENVKLTAPHIDNGYWLV